MKKLTLLLIPALLALSACQGGGSSINPSSESSSESPRLPTIDELIDASADGKYQLTAIIENYDDGELDERFSYRLSRDGDKLYREAGVEDGEEFEYEPEMYGVLTGLGEGETYVLINDVWVIEPDVHDKIYEGFGFFMDVTNYFIDIKDCFDNDWTFDEENAQYHGVNKEGFDPFEATVQLVPGFFSTFNIHVSGDGFDQRLYLKAAYLNEIEVVLPEVTANKITDDMWAVNVTYMSAISFTMSLEEKVHNDFEDYERSYLYKMVFDPETITTTLKAVYPDESIRYFRCVDGEDYYAKTPSTDWEEIDESDFESAMQPLFEIKEFLSCPSPEIFARFAILLHFAPGDLQIIFPESDDEHVTLKYDPETYVPITYISEKPIYGEINAYQYSDFNNTVID